MGIRTVLCGLLGIEHPIIQGGMAMAGNAELAAAVSEGGGLGMIGANPGWVPNDELQANLRRQIAIALERTKKPVGLNFTLFTIPPEQRISMINMAADAGIAVAGTSGGNPAALIPHFHQRGMKVIHVVGNARQAISAAEAGADVVVAEGFEAGGVNAPDEIPTLPLVPVVVDAVRIPVIAAGGIADGRGLAAALALGASGVQMGTRFIASEECHAHPAFKEAILRAKETDTVITGRKLKQAYRTRRTPFTEKLYELDHSAATPEDVRLAMGRDASWKGQLAGDAETGIMSFGVGAAMVQEILPAAEIVRRIVRQAEQVLQSISSYRRQ
ncbi:MAG: nitronate monooxygenase [Chloroflexi bacterium]|nr:nitronate monooxygenase [Chloroflexota bacterium]